MPVLSDDPLESRRPYDAAGPPDPGPQTDNSVEGPTEDSPIPELTPEQIAALNALARVAGNLQSLQQRKNGWGGRRLGAGAPRGNLNALKHGKHSRRVQDFIEAVGSNPTTRETLAAIARRQRRQRREAEKVAALLISGILNRVLASLENNENEEEIARLRAILAAFVEEKISGNQSPPPYKSRNHSRRASQLTDAFLDQFGLSSPFDPPDPTPL